MGLRRKRRFLDLTFRWMEAVEWNALCRRLARAIPVRLTFLDKSGFRHPWNIVSRWSPDNGEWLFNVWPGFCDDEPAQVRLEKEQFPKAYLDHLEAKGEDVPARSDVGLEFDPYIPIPRDLWRAIGSTGSPGMEPEPVPEFFLNMGVLPAQKVYIETEALSITTDLGDVRAQAEARGLRAVDLVLVKDRPATTAQFEAQSGVATFQLGFTGTVQGRASLSLRRSFAPSSPQAISIAEQIAGGFVDDSTDEILLATIYALSVPGEGTGEVTGAWSIFVKYTREGRWNLNYGLNFDLDMVQNTRLQYPGLGLAGGVGDLFIVEAVDGLNDTYTSALALLNQTRIKGYFWSI